MNKFITALLLFTASAFGAGIPYLTEPTNSRVDTYIPSATGPNQKWVPYLNVTNAISNIVIRPGPGATVATNVNGVDYTIGTMWSTNAADGSVTNINPGSGIVSVGGLTAAGHATLMSDNLATGGRLYNGKSNSVVVYAVDGSGDLVRIKNIPYIWPTSNAAVGQVLASTASGLLYWTNSTSSPFVAAGTNITLVTNGPVVTINGNPSDLWTNDLDGSIRILRPVDQTRMVEVFHIGTNSIAVEGLIQNTNAAAYSQAGYFENLGTNSGIGSLSGASGGSFGLIGESAGDRGSLTNGDGIGIQGVADSGFKAQYGVQGRSKALYNTQTNVGGAFSANSNGKTGTTNVGIYVETQTGAGLNSNLVSSVAQLNSRDGSPIISGQTNGTTSYLLRADGSQFIGKNVGQDINENDFGVVYPLYQLSMTDSNEPASAKINFGVVNNENYDFYATFFGAANGGKDGSISYLAFSGGQTNGQLSDVKISADSNVGPSILSKFGGTNNWSFSLNAFTLHGVDYIPPTTNATAGKVLASDGGSPQQLYWTNQPSGGSGGGSGVGPGTAKRVAMFDSTTTNVTDSSLINTATNQIEFRQTNVPYATTMTNYLAVAAYTNGTGFRGFEVDVDATGYVNMEQQLGSGVNPATFSRAGIRFNQAWVINGWGPTATGDGGGKTPDFLPNGDNVHDVGSSSSRVRHFVSGELGYGATANASAPNFGAAGSGFGINASAIDVWNSNGPRKTASFYPISGMGSDFSLEFYSPAGIASGSPLFSPDVFLHRPITYKMWALGTNNNSTTKAAPTILGGAASDDNAVNRAGGDLVLVGGPASGNGTNGNVSLGTFIQGASGFGYGSLQTNRLTIHSMPINLTTNSATTILTFTVPTSLTCVGAKVSTTVEIKDSTDIATLSEAFRVSAVNKSATVTATNSVSAESSFIATGSAGMTTTWSTSVSGTTVSLKCNLVTTGILATTARVVGARIELDSDALSVVNFQ